MVKRLPVHPEVALALEDLAAVKAHEPFQLLGSGCSLPLRLRQSVEGVRGIPDLRFNVGICFRHPFIESVELHGGPDDRLQDDLASGLGGLRAGEDTAFTVGDLF